MLRIYNPLRHLTPLENGTIRNTYLTQHRAAFFRNYLRRSMLRIHTRIPSH